jgi:predicted phosphodiesterase
MQRLVLGLAAVSLLGVAVAFSQPAPSNTRTELVLTQEGRNPWTRTDLNNDRDEFQFAIVSDRTGGHRDKIFSQAVERLNLLQPEFVVSVGDLIEGGGNDTKRLNTQWEEFDGYVARLQMPFFYVPGNHDVGNATTNQIWGEKFGRRHYHFVYRNVLFLCLNSEDPPGSGAGHFSKEQIDYARQTLAANQDVRWTVVIFHKPVWMAGNLAQTGWLEIEEALKGRNYTVFVGHVHRYQKFVRNGMNYYQLATTGGGSKLRGVEHGEFDHLVWVTMKKTGPVLANVLLDSILAEDLKVPESNEQGVLTANRRPTHPVRGQVYFEGLPVPGAYVVLQSVLSPSVRADGLVEADGSLRLSTYTAYDGVPAGEYNVSVAWRKPFRDGAGKPGPNLLPPRYAEADKSGIRVRIQEGVNDLVLELKR